MVKNLLLTYGLGASWMWWLFAPMSGPTRIFGGVALLLATIGLTVSVRIRARRLRSDHEGIPGKLVTHVGAGQSRWDHEDDDGLESTVGGGW